jgi:hypothetical protein
MNAFSEDIVGARAVPYFFDGFTRELARSFLEIICTMFHLFEVMHAPPTIRFMF